MAILNKDKELEKVLLGSKVVAIVELSSNPTKDSYIVAKFLSENGFRIIPVNPNAKEVLAVRAYPSLLNIPEYNAKNIDIVNIFRPSEEMLDIAKEVCELKRRYGRPNCMWMQIGISSLEAANVANEYGIDTIMNRCIMMECRRLCPGFSNDLKQFFPKM